MSGYAGNIVIHCSEINCIAMYHSLSEMNYSALNCITMDLSCDVNCLKVQCFALHYVTLEWN